ncbi:hypothetical protein PVAND_006168 [Polypedilum vanderplanki]|uniref:Ig-like domain-containing protein n=1 Tax=Polypedilum vanderplanki TaxID=319348 RepID=A0A9J6C2S3_POLVA|nr:hypothetical protein PVAND_006168 [Polypedilum vanderplanki]
MVRERRGKKSKSKEAEEAPPVLETLQVPEEPAINRFFKREKSPFEVGDKKELQVASSNAIIDKACVMDISGGAAKVAAKVDEYINLLFTDYCALDQASCGDISKEIKIVVIEEDSEPTAIQPSANVEAEEEARKQAEEAAAKAAQEAEEARKRAEQEATERAAREEEERKAREEAERLAAEEAERKRKEEEEEAKKKAEEEEKRKKAEEEAKKKAEEEEKKKKEAEEKARKEAEEEEARKKAEEEAYDSDKDIIPPKEDDGIEWEAVEEEAPLVPDVLQELLEQREAEGAEATGDESEKEMTERDRDLEWQRQRQMMRPPLVISHLKSRAVPVGSIAKLTCNVTGPGIMVRWLKNGNPIEIKPEKYKFFNSEGLLSLEILNVEKSDAADYTCFVKNKNGETETVANVTVYENDIDRPTPPTFVSIKDRNKQPEPEPEPEKIEYDKWGDPIKKKKRKVRPLSLWAQREKFEWTVHLPKTHTVIEDRNARFICGVTGGGKIDIIWYKDGKKIRFEKQPRILDYTRNSTGCIGIECTTMKDAGVYTCKFVNTDSGEELSTSCQLIVVPRLKRTKELSKQIPPTFVRKLQYTYKPEENQLVVHCTILANPEPDIKWYVNKVPLHLCPLPRITIFTHPDDVHEHTIASLVILGPTYLDNGDYVIEVKNDAGFERRCLNIQFQTEEEYNEKYYQRYMEHKEHFKLHEFGPNEVRWEDVVPEVREFHRYVPEEEAKKVSTDGKVRKRRKKHRYVKKKVMTPWGEEKEVDVTDEDASSESYTAGESEEEKEEEEEEIEEEEQGWNVEGEVDDDEEEAPAETNENQPIEQTSAKEPTPPPKEPTPEIVKEATPEPIKEPTPPPKEPTPPAIQEEETKEDEEAAEIIEPLKKMSFQVPQFEIIEPTIDIYDPDYVRKQHENLEYPYIYRRPKFHITEYQLRKKFQFVNKLIDVELVKGKTLRLESFIACLGKVTPEWRFKGHVISSTVRRTIEYNPHRNLTAIEIENTRLQDSGVYSIVWYNDYTEPMIDSCRVNIILPKTAETFEHAPTFTRLLTDTYKEWTDELILDCHVRGVPKPKIQWFKNGIEVVPENQERYETKQDDDGNCSLIITHPIKNADRGRYVVKATNSVGEETCELRVWFRGKEDDDMAERAEYRRTQKMYKSRHVKPKDEDEWPGPLYHSKRLDKQKEYDHRYKLTWLSRIISTTIAQGSTLKLVAFVAGKYPQFDWYFNDIPLVHSRKYKQVVTNNGKGCLIVNNVQPSDSGTYKLIVKNYANSIDCEAKVTVYAYEYKNFEPPLFINTLSDTYDQVTNKLIIECNIKSSLNFSNHKIKWYKDDMEIRPSYISSGGIPTTYEQELDENSGRVKLIITYPMNTDCGLYRCCILDRNSQKVDEISHLVYKIFNPPPHVPFEELDLSEKRKPIVFDNYLSDIFTDEGGKSIRLNCKISQYNAQSEIKWYKNNEELPVEDYREKYRFTKSYNRLCLEILHPTLNDSGAYECRVKNQYNEISSKCNVYVNERIERQRTRTSTKDTSYIDIDSGAIMSGGVGEYYFNDSETSNKILLERSTREIAARIHRSNNLYDSTSTLERPIFATPISDRTITENSESVKFTCSLLSTDCDITWEKNGVPLKPSSKYTQTFADGLAILEIFDVNDDDAGKYSCVASNKFGETVTSAKLKVYSGFKPSVSMPPTVMRQMKESYNLHHDLLTLECRVRGTPKPHIQWMKDGDYIIPGDKYEQTELPDGTCKLVIKSPDPEEDSGTYTCEAECNGCSDSISHNVQYEGSVENQFNRIHRYYHRDPLKPYFKTGLVDANVPSGGSIALYVETQANCEAEWYRDRWVVDHKPPKRYIFNDGNGFFACVINAATMDESAKYTCKVTNPYGTSQSSSFVDIINPNQVGKGQKPPIFISRPQPEIKIRAGDPFSMSFRIQGEPKPRIQWFKGAKEITNASRTIKEVFNDYVRFSIKESKENDSGIYFIVARNKHGVDRGFCQVTVRERQELDVTQLSSNIDYTDVSYMKNKKNFDI